MKTLLTNDSLTTQEAQEAKAFYQGLNHESEVTGKIYMKGLDVDLMEFKGKEGFYFYLSRNGKELFVVRLQIAKI
jgi:hypothetical protein